jgi:hypothetical protein
MIFLSYQFLPILINLRSANMENSKVSDRFKDWHELNHTVFTHGSLAEVNRML